MLNIGSVSQSQNEQWRAQLEQTVRSLPFPSRVKVDQPTVLFTTARSLRTKRPISVARSSRSVCLHATYQWRGQLSLNTPTQTAWNNTSKVIIWHTVPMACRIITSLPCLSHYSFLLDKSLHQYSCNRDLKDIIFFTFFLKPKSSWVHFYLTAKWVKCYSVLTR